MNKQQVLTIWWGEVVENLASKDFLKNRLEFVKEFCEYNPYKINKKWKSSLQKDLWDDYEVLKSPNPSSDSAVYEEWKVMFEKTFPYIKDNVILLWHSLWGTFIAKYLNENTLPFTVSKILLVAPAYEDSEQEVLWSFNFEKKLDTFKQYSDKTIMYYSLDDEVVPPSDFEKFKHVLTEMKYVEFEDRGHFSLEEFPEVIKEIKAI